LWEFGMSGSFYLLSIICQKKQADDDPDSDQVSINFGTYSILYQTECTRIRNMLMCRINHKHSSQKNVDTKKLYEMAVFKISEVNLG